MKALFFNKPVNNFISLCLLLCCAYIAWACSEDEPYDGYDSNYTPETFVANKASHPFLLSYDHYFYYGIYSDTTRHIYRFNNRNVAEWQLYLGVIDKETLHFWLNKAKAKDIENLALIITKGEKKTLSGNAQKYAKPFLQDKNTQTLNFIEYLPYAKKCESLVVVDNFWVYDPQEVANKANANKLLLNKLLKAFDAATDAFMKQRYAFQITRFYYYIEPAKATAFFEKHRADLEKSAFFYRIMTYAAGAYVKQRNYSQANYYYSLAFVANDELKTIAHWNFHPQHESDWKKTLALCKNNREKATLWQMLGIFYADEARSIREIYKIDPQSEEMELLLTRIINKVERKHARETFPELDGEPQAPADPNPPYDNYWSYDEQIELEKEKRRAELTQQKHQRQLNDALKLIMPIANKDNTANPFLWNLSTGYLHFLLGNIPQAQTYYQKAEMQVPDSDLAKKQLRLLQLIADIGHIAHLPKIETKHENQLLPELKWLYGQKIDNPDKFRVRQAQDDIEQILAQKYAAQNDSVKSECWVSNPEFYTSQSNISQFTAFFSKNNPTPYEQFCISKSRKKLADVWEYEAIQATFADNLDEAISCLQYAPDAAKSELLGNPFGMKIQDCSDCDHRVPMKTKYTKLSFLKKMHKAKQKIERGEEVCNNALLLGNAYYNITHYGNARLFYESEILGSDHYSPFDIYPYFKNTLLDNCTAQYYYELALQHATNKEQKAKCYYLMAKCERNNWYNDNEYNYYNNYDYYIETMKGYRVWHGFKELQKLSDTKYYQEVLKECGYFAKIVQKQRQLNLQLSQQSNP